MCLIVFVNCLLNQFAIVCSCYSICVECDCVVVCVYFCLLKTPEHECMCCVCGSNVNLVVHSIYFCVCIMSEMISAFSVVSK